MAGSIGRYAFFAYDTYYPGGGWNDFVRAFDTIEEVELHLSGENPEGHRLSRSDIWQVIDLQTGEHVPLKATA